MDPFDVKNYSNIDDLVDDVLVRIPLHQIAQKLAMSSASAHSTVHTARHRIYRQIKGWKSLLGTSKDDGLYLELLAIIKAYPEYAAKRGMLERAYHLVSVLQEKLHPEWKQVSGILYALDPLVPTIRNLTDMIDFPISEAEIPDFAEEQVIWLEGLHGHKRLFKSRVLRTWNFLRAVDAVYFSAQLGRWEKSKSVVWTPWKNRNFEDSLLKMRHHLYLQEFTQVMFTPDCLFSTQMTFAVPEKHLGVVREVVYRLNQELLESLSFALNSDFLDHLRQTDESRYWQAMEFTKKLADKGISFEPATMKDKHCLIRVGSIGRRVTK